MSPPQSSARRPLTRSQTSPKFTASITPSHTIVEPSTTSEPSTSASVGKAKSTRPRESAKVNLQIVLQDLNELQDFEDVGVLTTPQITELDKFFDEDDNLEKGSAVQRSDDDDDSEGSEYDDVETDEFEQESLDEENGESDGLEDIDLDSSTEGRKCLGYEFEDEDGSSSQLLVNKMARVFKEGKLWRKG